MHNITLSYFGILLVLAFINFAFVIFVNYLVRKPTIKKTYGLEVKQEQISREIRNAIITTPVHAILFALFIWFGWLNSQEGSLLTTIITFLLTFLWTEIWHYFSHIAMHTKPLHFIHYEHHKSRVTNPWTTVSFSFLEKFIFSSGIIGFMSILSHITPISFYGITIYYVLYFYTNTLGHANFEIRKPQYYETFLGKIFNTPSFHAMHHARYRKNYGLMTPCLDKLFGTAWEDFSEVQTKVSEGIPMKSLMEKIDIH